MNRDVIGQGCPITLRITEYGDLIFHCKPPHAVLRVHPMVIRRFVNEAARMGYLKKYSPKAWFRGLDLEIRFAAQTIRDVKLPNR